MDSVPERVLFVTLVTNHGLGAQMVLSISSDLKITKNQCLKTKYLGIVVNLSLMISTKTLFDFKTY